MDALLKEGSFLSFCLVCSNPSAHFFWTFTLEWVLRCSSISMLLERGLVFLPLIFLLYLLLAEFDWWPSHQLGLCSWKLLVCSRPLPILSQYFFISHKWLGCPVSVTVVENDHFALNYFSLSSDKSVSSSPVKVCYCCILDFFKSFSPYHLCWVFYRICFFLEYFWTLSQHRFICHLPLLF